MTISEILGGLAITIIGGLTGHNYRETALIREKMAEKYRDKDECAHICGTIQKTMDKMETTMQHGFDRIYAELKDKEDKN